MSPDRYTNLRKKIGSQEEVASRLGSSRSAISRRERGNAAISEEDAAAIRRLHEAQQRSGLLPLVAFPPSSRSSEKAAQRRKDRDSLTRGESPKSIQVRNSRLGKRGIHPLVIPNLREALSH